jgi:hypothetical protein
MSARKPQPEIKTLFERLAAIRERLVTTRSEIDKLIDDLGSNVLSDDLPTQLKEALQDLDSAIDYCKVRPYHVNASAAAGVQH